MRERFAALAKALEAAGHAPATPEQIAEGFLHIAVENMANAIKHISVQRGYDVTGYTLCCFGGAGGQHACAVADALGMTQVFIHPLAGVLSAYGMGLADVRALRQQALEAPLSAATLAAATPAFDALERAAREEISQQGIDAARIGCARTLHLKYEGTDTTLAVALQADPAAIVADFERRYLQQYGFLMPGRAHTDEALAVEAVGRAEVAAAAPRAFAHRSAPLSPIGLPSSISNLLSPGPLRLPRVLPLRCRAPSGRQPELTMKILRVA